MHILVGSVYYRDPTNMCTFDLWSSVFSDSKDKVAYEATKAQEYMRLMMAQYSVKFLRQSGVVQYSMIEYPN